MRASDQDVEDNSEPGVAEGARRPGDQRSRQAEMARPAWSTMPVKTDMARRPCGQFGTQRPQVDLRVSSASRGTLKMRTPRSPAPQAPGSKSSHTLERWPQAAGKGPEEGDEAAGRSQTTLREPKRKSEKSMPKMTNMARRPWMRLEMHEQLQTAPCEQTGG